MIKCDIINRRKIIATSPLCGYKDTHTNECLYRTDGIYKKCPYQYEIKPVPRAITERREPRYVPVIPMYERD
jgi:hypothetical protein